MNIRLVDALAYCQAANLRSFVLAVPFPLSAKEMHALRQQKSCRGIVLYQPQAETQEKSTDAWIGRFLPDGDWALPAARGRLVFVGSPLMLSHQMALRVLKSGRLSVVCHVHGRYQSMMIHRFTLWRYGERLYQGVAGLPSSSPIRRLLFGIAASPFVQRAWRRIFRRAGLVHVEVQGTSGLTGEPLYRELLRGAQSVSVTLNSKPIPGRVVLVNAGLAAGGAERQIVNTLIGLKRSGFCESVCLLAEYIDHAPNLDFFLHELVNSQIEVAQVEHRVSLAYDGLSSVPPQIADLLASLPASILEDVLNLLQEFLERRPQVVHAWQDSSSIKAGIAAVIAGVPVIVLASRNMIPTNFTYHEEYMRPAYRALAEIDSVHFVNNSEAGAADYTQWLGIDQHRFTVVRNGVDLTDMQQLDKQATLEYRLSLGIPLEARVVGSVFRFWSEKRPLLWLQAAAVLATRLPDVHFLVIGDGPLRREMEAFVAGSTLADRIHLPGARPDVAVPLSILDVFVLTSAFEGTPNVVLEAQWLGIPVVATEAGGTREAFDPGTTGLIAHPPSPDVIASSVEDLLQNPEFLAKASSASRKFVASRFGMSRMIRETLALYQIPMGQAEVASAHPTLR